jgi:hypothetical protein
MKRFEFMIRGAATALVGFGVLTMCPAAQAQSVSVNSTPVCSSAPSLTMTPAGDLSITCTPVSTGGGTPTTVPSCTISSPPITWSATQTATISASCTGAPNAFAWTNTDAAPGFTNTSTASITVGPFPAPTTAAVNYRFSMIANNSVGPSLSAGVTLTVNPAPAGGGGTGSCSTSAVSGVFAGIRFNPLIPRGGFVAYQIPVLTAPARLYYQFTSTQDTRTQDNLPVTYAVSTCPGDFTSPSAVCQNTGVANTGSTSVIAYGDPAQTGNCVLTAGTTYYLNVRNGPATAPACNNSGGCYMYVSMNVGFY